MNRSEHYCAGKASGESYAERDLADGLSIHHDQIAFFRAQGIRDVHGENNRAFYLGFARGYRKVVMTRSGDYRDGLSLGAAYADADGNDLAACGSIADELRAEAIEARGDSPSWRAFKLGIVRGYRNSVRTLRAGKWGT